MKLPKLQISAKAKSWRIHDDDNTRMENKDDYEQARPQVLRRDKMTCQFCGFKSIGDNEKKKNTLFYSGFLEVHHLDDDHSNNSLDNLVTACPFCHSVFHSGFAGHQNGAKIAFMPYLKQEEISLLFNLLAVIHHTEESEYHEIKEEIIALFDYFSGVSETIVEGLSDAATMGSVLVGLQIKNPKEYEKINSILWGLRLIPDIKSDAFKKAADYWKTNGVWVQEAQWEGILNGFLKLNQKSLKK